MEKQEFSEKDKKIYSFFIVFIFMIGNVYKFPYLNVLGIGEVCCILYIIYLFLVKKIIFKKNIINKWVILFIGYSMTTTLINIVIYNFNANDSVIRMIRDAFYYFLIFYIGTKLYDIDCFKNMIIIFCLLLSTFIILQFSVYKLSGYYIPGFLLNAQINSGNNTGMDMYNHYIEFAKITGYLKANGFLCEAASCAQCFSVGLMLILHYKFQPDRKNIIIALYVTIGAILTFSANSIVYCIFIWGIWVIRQLSQRYISKKIYAFIILLCIFLGIFFVIFKDSNVSNVFKRLQSATSSDTLDGSAQSRVYKGIKQYLELPLYNKIMGIGFGNYSEAYKNEIIQIENEYMNSLSYILFSCGFIGLIIYFLIFLCNWKEKKFINKIALATLMLIMFASSIYSSSVYVWIVSIIIADIKDSEVKNKNEST